MNMTKTLEIAFAEMDKEVLAKQIEWAKERRAALKEFRASDEYKAINNEWDRYAKLHSIAGGKTWYNIFDGRNEAMINEIVTKNCAAIAAKRNANIVAKLEKKGINEIGNLEFNRTSDGFHGWFTFEGATIHIETIIAGGYNIQCLHQRTLVKVTGR